MSVPHQRSLWLSSALLLLLPLASSASQESASLSLPAINRSYSDVVPPLDPIYRGPLTISPSVPRSTLHIRHHKLSLSPIGDDVFDATLEITLAGHGVLTAELAVIGSSTTMRDEVTLPPQTLFIPARIQLSWSDQGLAITTLTLPSALDLRVESGIGDRLLASCESLAALLPIGCNGIADSVSRIQVPLAEPGGTYLLPSALIDSESLRGLSRLLEPSP